ncbi:MAG: hypothetical protein ACREP6_08295 [Candidatus Binataceae bacterium]
MAAFLIAAAIACVAVFLSSRPAVASDVDTQASQLSNQAFALLSAVTAAKTDASSNPLIGPVAGFAGDAQTLSSALKRGDTAGAASALTQLQGDRSDIDSAAAAHPGMIDAAKWASIKSRLDGIAAQLTPGSIPPAATTGGRESSPYGRASTPASVGAPGIGGAAASVPGNGLKVVIESRSRNGDSLRIKGWLQGADLKSGGLYEGGHRLASLKIDQIRGPQRVRFDLKIANVRPGIVLRIYNDAGQSAEAPLLNSSVASISPGKLRGERPDLSGAPDSGSTAEIPSHSGGAAGLPPVMGMGAVRINITSVNLVNAMPHDYELIGQISGVGVHRAGVFVNGRLMRRIPLVNGAAVSNFDVQFATLYKQATIRAYGLGSNYVETSINLGSALPEQPPVIVRPYGGYNPYYPNYGMNPYAGVNPAYPYGYPNPYGLTPYGAPRSPYGAPVPYGYTNPSPYGYPNPYSGAPATPWWQRLIP